MSYREEMIESCCCGRVTVTKTRMIKWSAICSSIRGIGGGISIAVALFTPLPSPLEWFSLFIGIFNFISALIPFSVTKGKMKTSYMLIMHVSVMIDHMYNFYLMTLAACSFSGVPTVLNKYFKELLFFVYNETPSDNEMNGTIYTCSIVLFIICILLTVFNYLVLTIFHTAYCLLRDQDRQTVYRQRILFDNAFSIPPVYEDSPQQEKVPID